MLCVVAVNRGLTALWAGPTCLQVVLGFVYEADFKVVAKAVRDRVAAVKRQREKLRRRAEERRRMEEQEATEGEEEEEEEEERVAHAPPPAVSPAPCPSPVTSSADSGVGSSHPAEVEEAETERRHNSLSSLNCECCPAPPGGRMRRRCRILNDQCNDNNDVEM